MYSVYGGKEKEMSSGRVFQSLGPAAANERFPTDTFLDEGTKR